MKMKECGMIKCKCGGIRKVFLQIQLLVKFRYKRAWGVG